VTEIERIEHAMYATANRLGGGTLEWTDDWVQLTTPDAKTDYRNVVYRSVLQEDEVDARVSEVIEQHRRMGVGFRWWVTPSTRPADMGTRLEAHGFEHIDDVEGMVADANEFPEPGRDDIEVVRIGIAEDGPSAHYFMARRDGAPVGSCALSILDGYGHFAGSVVIPEHRRCGVYREMIHERMRFLRSTGLRDVTNTCVKTTSAPICAMLGFRKAFDSRIYRHAGGG
jgi:GNAT superfamily N-acetyltransferase